MAYYSAGTPPTNIHTAMDRSTDIEVDVVVEPNVVVPYVFETVGVTRVVVVATAGTSSRAYSAGEK